MPVNQEAIAPTIVALWRQRGPETLVKVWPLGRSPRPEQPVGLCTSLRFLLGRTPLEMERVLGSAAEASLVGGVDVLEIDPLPQPGEFELRGYAERVDAFAPQPGTALSHPLYSPSLGAPKWDLVRVPQSRLRLLTRVQRNEPFAFEVRRLAPLGGE